MKSFKEFQKERGSLRDKPPVLVWYEPDDLVAADAAAKLIEEGKDYTLDNRYSARWDRAQQPNQQNHTHIYLKGNEVLVVNDDGTPSHNSDPYSVLPTKIQDKMRELKLLPANRVIKEQASNGLRVLIPRAVFLNLWLNLLAGR